jgi:hypothetical protein
VGFSGFFIAHDSHLRSQLDKIRTICAQAAGTELAVLCPWVSTKGRSELGYRIAVFELYWQSASPDHGIAILLLAFLERYIDYRKLPDSLSNSLFLAVRIQW